MTGHGHRPGSASPAPAGGPGGIGGPGGPRPGSGPGSGPPHMAMMMPTAKPANFRAGFRRLLGELRPERPLVLAVVLLGVVSVAFAIAGPRILGEATNVIFDGAVGNQLGSNPALDGLSTDQIVAGLRAEGQDNLADMLANMDN